MKKKIINIIVLGPQGSGKGTQAKLLARRFNLAHIEVGEILRLEAKRKTKPGRFIDRLINKEGKMVPFQTVMNLTYKKVAKVPANRGIVFDGTPRRMPEVRFWEKHLPKLKREFTHVFYLPISKKTTLKRLGIRRNCRKCGTPFILGVDLKKNQKKCLKCGGEIYQREDDKPKAILQRLKLYYQKTKPVVSYYHNKGLLIKVNGEPAIPVVYKNILKHIR